MSQDTSTIYRPGAYAAGTVVQRHGHAHTTGLPTCNILRPPGCEWDGLWFCQARAWPNPRHMGTPRWIAQATAWFGREQIEVHFLQTALPARGTVPLFIQVRPHTHVPAAVIEHIHALYRSMPA